MAVTVLEAIRDSMPTLDALKLRVHCSTEVASALAALPALQQLAVAEKSVKELAARFRG